MLKKLNLSQNCFIISPWENIFLVIGIICPISNKSSWSHPWLLTLSIPQLIPLFSIFPKYISLLSIPVAIDSIHSFIQQLVNRALTMWQARDTVMHMSRFQCYVAQGFIISFRLQLPTNWFLMSPVFIAFRSSFTLLTKIKINQISLVFKALSLLK